MSWSGGEIKFFESFLLWIRYAVKTTGVGAEWESVSRATPAFGWRHGVEAWSFNWPHCDVPKSS
jgi:hypothetical protein